MSNTPPSLSEDTKNIESLAEATQLMHDTLFRLGEIKDNWQVNPETLLDEIQKLRRNIRKVIEWNEKEPINNEDNASIIPMIIRAKNDITSIIINPPSGSFQMSFQEKGHFINSLNGQSSQKKSGSSESLESNATAA